jgi:hypothetical protein
MAKVALRSGDWIYFFCGDQYIRVHRPGDTGAGTVDGGPSNISTWGWPDGFARHGIDTAFKSGTKTYFFSGDQFIRVTREDTGEGELDKQRNISEWGWPGGFGSNRCGSLSSPGIDASLRSGRYLYFFCGDQYILLDRPDDTGVGTHVLGPVPIYRWGWPIDFGSRGVDAAFTSGTKTYFFSGDRYIRVTRGESGAGVVDKGYPAPISDWHWPATFQDCWTQIGSNFKFANQISVSRRNRLLERHRFAYSRIRGCGSLKAAERAALIEAYHRPIRHGINSNRRDNSSACVGMNQIFINFAKLFPKGDQEIAQSLIHEMMHCAGYSHRKWLRTDSPMDGGTYYNSLPLQAELCIAGAQSSAECLESEESYYALRAQSQNGVG